MESLFLAGSVVVPLLVYMVVGMLIRRFGILDRETLKKLNGMIFRVPLPLSLFFEIYRSDLRSSVQPKLLLLAGGLVVLVYALACLLMPRFVPDPKESTTMVQGTFRSNFVLFGTVIGTSLCGAEGAALSASMAVLIVPLFNILTVILFESLRGGRVDFAGLIGRIFRNPLVDAGLAGVLCNLLQIRIPEILSAPLITLGGTATPLALVALGGQLSFQSMVSHRGYLLSVVFLRLVAVPAFALSVMAGIGYRNVELVVLMAIFASPTAVASAPMAQSMGGDGLLAGEIVAVSSIASIVTIFLIIVTLSGLGLLQL